VTNARGSAKHHWIALNPKDAAPTIIGLAIYSETLNGASLKVPTNKSILFSISIVMRNLAHRRL
jgi:hypothetical protein